MRTFKHQVNGEPVPIYYPERDEDLDGFERFINAAPRVIAADTETTGLKIFSKGFKCRLVQFGDTHEAWVLRADQFAGVIRKTLARPDLRFVAHNLPYDALVLDRVGLAPLEVLGPKAFDTALLAHLCDPRTERDGGIGHALKKLSTVYVDPDAADTQDGLNAIFLGLYRDWKKTVSIDVIEEWQRRHPKKPHVPFGFTNIAIDHPLYVTYAGLDVIYTARLLAELSILIKQSDMSKLAHFEHRVQLITTHQQRRGLRVDVDYTRKLVDNLDREATKYARAAAAYGVENINSTKQVTEGLLGMGETWTAKTDSGNPAVGKEVLLPMADLEARTWERLGVRDPNPLADAIVRSKRASKWRESYALPFLEDRDENDRIHPSIKSLAARTARMSVSGPPLQQLPSGDWTIRRSIIADPGHVIIAADYAAVEMRVLAAMADVKEMKRLIAEDADLHTETARMVYGSAWDAAEPSAQKRMRGLMKTVGFGKVYGGGATGLARQSGLPYDQVKHAVDRYDDVYPEIPAYGRRLQRTAAYGGGAVITPIGRRLPLDRDRAYAATNYAVQSTARDLLARALCAIDDAGMSEFILLPVHDELVAQAPAADAEEVIHEIGRLMESTFMGVPIASDPELYGSSWGNGYGCSVGAGKDCKRADDHPHKWGVFHAA